MNFIKILVILHRIEKIGWIEYFYNNISYLIS